MSTASPHIRLGVSELLGTAALVLVGVSAVSAFFGMPAVEAAMPGYWPRIVAVLFCFGAVIAAVISSPVGRISGAHINPAVSIALAMAGRLPLALLPTYLLGQLAGGVLGAWLALLLFGEAALAVNLAVTTPSPDFPLWASCAAEFVGNAMLLWLVFAVARPRLLPHAPWLIGGFIWIYGSLTAHISGASFNPARSFGPAVVAGDFQWLWLYLAVPVAGSLLPVFSCRLYTRFMRRGNDQHCCQPAWRAVSVKNNMG